MARFFPGACTIKLFFFIFVVSIIKLVDNFVDKILLIVGFEPRISGVGSDQGFLFYGKVDNLKSAVP